MVARETRTIAQYGIDGAYGSLAKTHRNAFMLRLSLRTLLLFCVVATGAVFAESTRPSFRQASILKQKDLEIQSLKEMLDVQLQRVEQLDRQLEGATESIRALDQELYTVQSKAESVNATLERAGVSPAELPRLLRKGRLDAEQLADVRKELERTLRENKQLSSDLETRTQSQTESNLGEMQEHIERANQRLADQSRQLEALEADLSGLKRELSTKDAALGQLQQSTNDQLAVFDKFGVEPGDLAAVLAEHAELKVALDASVATTDTEKRLRQGSSRVFQAQLDEAAARQSRLETLLAASEQRTRAATDDQEMLRRRVSSLQNVTTALQSELDGSRQVLESRTAQITELQAEVSYLQSERGELSDSLNRLRKERLFLDNMLAEEGFAQSGINGVIAERNALVGSLEDADARVRELTGVNADLRSQLDDAHGQLNRSMVAQESLESVSRQLETAREQSAVLSDELDTLNNRTHGLEASLAASLKREAASVTGQQELTDKLALERAAAIRVQAAFDSVSSRLTTSQNEASQLRQAMQNALTEAAERERSYSTTIQAFTSDIEAERQASARLQEALTSVTSKLDAGQKVTSGLRKALELAESEGEQDAHRVDELSAELVSLTKESGRLKAALSALQAQRRDEDALFEKFGQDRTALSSVLESSRMLSVSLEAAREEATGLSAQVSALSERNTSLENALTEAAEREQSAGEAMQALAIEIETERTAAAEARAELLASKEAVTTLTADQQSLRQELKLAQETAGVLSEDARKILSKLGESGATVVDTVRELSGKWGIAFDLAGPIGYVARDSAIPALDNVPLAAECADLALGFNNDPSLIDKLTVDGFPVTSFWVKKSRTSLTLCEIKKRGDNPYHASVKRVNASRNSWAIVPVPR